MTLESLLEFHQKQSEKHTAACGQLGSYESLLWYAIRGLRGETACTPNQVANFLEERHVELLKEQRERVFPSLSKE